ncbi:hypothetical protein E8E13_002425 [Curvularia kusanoi]|uniref:Heterokaryon incompatibility domain-containing protein n=1 Tax=Curvularia kusanoi TaxID=90978 RepID=A0A9P4T551_CURKU|nr:hypothetical protein E8E13_002425 [Curvularia kusanoi]
MTLNGNSFPITKNLECGLRHLRSNQSARVLWVDAICIDQKDYNERSKQVAMIGEIYNKACVFDILREFQARKRETLVPAHFDAAQQLHCYRQLFCGIVQKSAGHLPERCSLDDAALYKEINWLRPLFDRCYWRRVWIVQELTLAKSVIVCCRDKSISFDDIYGLSPDLGSFEQGFDAANHRKVKPHVQGWNIAQAIRGHRRRREPSWAVVGQIVVMNAGLPDQGDIMMLDEAIELYGQHHKCKDQRDEVYGLRELVPQWKHNLIVDYSRSVLDVFLDVARLDFLNSEAHGGWHVAFTLWSAMNLGPDQDGFNECIRRRLSEDFCTVRGTASLQRRNGLGLRLPN